MFDSRLVVNAHFILDASVLPQRISLAMLILFIQFEEFTGRSFCNGELNTGVSTCEYKVFDSRLLERIPLPVHLFDCDNLHSAVCPVSYRIFRFKYARVHVYNLGALRSKTLSKPDHLQQ